MSQKLSEPLLLIKALTCAEKRISKDHLFFKPEKTDFKRPGFFFRIRKNGFEESMFLSKKKGIGKGRFLQLRKK